MTTLFKLSSGLIDGFAPKDITYRMTSYSTRKTKTFKTPSASRFQGYAIAVWSIQLFLWF